VLPAFKNLACSYTVDRQHFERRQDLKNLVMMDGVYNIAAALYWYWGSEARMKHAMYDAEARHQHRYSESIVKINAPLEKGFLKRFLRNGVAGPRNPYGIPEICEARTITERETAEEYETAKIWFAKLKEGFFVDLSMKREGHPTLVVRCPADATFGHIVEFHRIRMGIGTDAVIQRSYGKGYFEVWNWLQHQTPYSPTSLRGTSASFYLAVTEQDGSKVT